MGADGGSIPTRKELVKRKKTNQEPDKQIVSDQKWNFCALSKERLEKPVVSCALGKLYNKDAIVKYLLGDEKYGEGDAICSHVKRMKDLVTLNLKDNPSYDGKSNISAKFVCPITLREMNGNSQFVYSRSCGCVMCLKAIKEMPSQDCCLVCGKPWPNCLVLSSVDSSSGNLLLINPSSKELDFMKSRISKKRSTKSKKRKLENAELGESDHKPAQVSTGNIVIPKVLKNDASSAIKSLYR